MRGLELYPDDRWQTIDQMLAQFREAAESPEPEPRKPTKLKKKKKKNKPPLGSEDQ